MIIRTVQENEIDHVIKLHLEGLQGELEYLNQLVKGKSVKANKEEVLKRILLTLVQTGEGQIFVAVHDGEHAGYCLATKKVYPVEDPSLSGCINGIYVKPEFRRQKLGLKLYQAAESWFKQDGISYIELYHMINDPKAVGFWKACGYTPVQLNCMKIIS